MLPTAITLSISRRRMILRFLPKVRVYLKVALKDT